MPDPQKRGLGVLGWCFRKPHAAPGSDRSQAAQKVVGYILKPSPPAPDSGFISRHASVVPGHGRLDALAGVALVGYQDIGKLVVDPAAILAAETTDDQIGSLSGVVGETAVAAADHLERSVTYRA